MDWRGLPQGRPVRIPLEQRVPRAPVPLCITRRALRGLLTRAPDADAVPRAMGYGPADRLGIERLDFGARRPDERGADRARWTATLRVHPAALAYPGIEVRPRDGDIEHAREALAVSPALGAFLLPMAVTDADGTVVIHPWLLAGDPPRLMWAELRVCRAADFPTRAAVARAGGRRRLPAGAGLAPDRQRMTQPASLEGSA